MPIIANAKKALRQDKRRTIVNNKVRIRMKEAIKAVQATSEASNLPAAYQTIDKAVKKNLLHKNKAARMKSQLAKLVAIKPEKETKQAPKTKVKPKKAAKTK